MDMHSLLQHLEAIERICTQERSNAQSTEKASTKNEKGNKRPGTESTYKIPKKAQTEKHCDLCKKHGAHISRTILKIVVGMRRTEMRNSTSERPRKAQENPIPQSSLSHSYARKWTS